MTQYRYFHVDAFTDEPLKGNQAAVMPMDAFADDKTLQAIAADNNFAETAYIVQTGDDSWDLRWFTPTREVPLCGHATQASAHVLYKHLGFEGETVHFDTKWSGRLNVERDADGCYVMDFPAALPKRCETPAGLAVALGCDPTELWSGPYILAVFEDAATVKHLSPDVRALSGVTAGVPGDQGHIICAAQGEHNYDVVSRFFAPGSGISEDAATGSAHCIIAPLFSKKIGKNDLTCYQAYPGRGAVIRTRLDGDRVKLIGQAVTMVEGTFYT